MLKVFTDKRYSGFVWHLLFAGVFIGLSLIFIEFTEGIMWYLISSVLRIIFGIAILIVSTRLFGRKASDILSFRNCKRALVAGCGFLLFFLYYVLTVASGFGKVT
ncbi:MAG: hypothetical protein IJS85_06350, partial [Clostridiales bacterium]|nr:hypothetical protein [Clostridiales bacterium]